MFLLSVYTSEAVGKIVLDLNNPLKLASTSIGMGLGLALVFSFPIGFFGATVYSTGLFSWINSKLFSLLEIFIIDEETKKKILRIGIVVIGKELIFHLFRSKVWQFGLVGLMAFLLGGALVFFTQVKTVVDVKDNAVLYSDGSAEVVFRDDITDGWRRAIKTTDLDYGVTYRSPILPHVITEEGSRPYYILPDINYIGASEKNVVFTYASEQGFCPNNIFYINRETKESRNITTDYCIGKALDGKDFTHWFGKKDNAEGYTEDIVVGRYADGSIVAHATIPRNNFVAHDSATANWELDMIVFSAWKTINTDNIEDECPTSIYSLNITNNELRDITPEEFCDSQVRLRYDGVFDAPRHSGSFYAEIGTPSDESHGVQYLFDRAILLDVQY